jgi:hypothetical protein
MQRNRADRSFQFSLLALLLVVTGVCFILASPTQALLCAASLATFMLGLACVRGALLNRIEGWISGLLFGSLFLVIGTAACVVSFGLFVGSLLGSR